MSLATAAAACASPSLVGTITVRGIANKIDSKSSRPALTVTGFSNTTSHTAFAAIRKQIPVIEPRNESFNVASTIEVVINVAP